MTEPTDEPPAPPSAAPVSPAAEPPAAPAASPADVPRAKLARRKRRQISLVWIIPAVAVLIGIYLVIHALRTTGPTIEIAFKTAEGLEANKTKIKYKNVDIGTISTVTLGKDRKSVIVTAKMAKNASDLLVDDTRFWIVKPRIAGGQISGLTTLLSGSYIGMDFGKSTESRREFVGLDVQPAVTTDEPGREFVLHAPDIGSLDIGSPVFFRRFQVGEVTAIDLDTDGKGVTIRIFVHAPNDKYVTRNTRFWQASGVDVNIDGNGLRVSTQSLFSILVGGIAFQNANDQPGDVAQNDASYALFGDQRDAMKRTDDQLENYMAFFSDSIGGLSVGAQVQWRGFVVGEVRSIEMKYDREKQDIYFPVEFALYKDVLPAKIDNAERAAGSPLLESSSPQADGRYRKALERGLRAQLRSGNLLTGQKYLALDYFKNPTPIPPKTPLRDEHGIRIVPTTPGSLDELQESVANIAKKIEKIPFDQLATEARRTLVELQKSLKNADTLIGNVNENVAPAVTATLDDVKRTMRNANETLANDSPLQQDLRSTLTELSRAAASLRLLTDFLQRHPESLLRGKAPEATLGSPPNTPPGVTPSSSSSTSEDSSGPTPPANQTRPEGSR